MTIEQAGADAGDRIEGRRGVQAVLVRPIGEDQVPEAIGSGDLCLRELAHGAYRYRDVPVSRPVTGTDTGRGIRDTPLSRRPDTAPGAGLLPVGVPRSGLVQPSRRVIWSGDRVDLGGDAVGEGLGLG
jgi:hypothetical protein